ncbi:DUF7501 family protein [Salinibaculum salinum]|uniref:DUF7501 family protein n=1 Tax=Salinibaculum salinum TaxID=3131996 RepID=UPI0030EC6B5C
MSDHVHPLSDAPNWDNPDYCPVCGQPLSDGGAGFVDHSQQEATDTCQERFETWRENIAGDVNGEWGG